MQTKMENPVQEPKIEILGVGDWQKYREIRLKALKTDPTAFGESYEREERKSEEETRELLSDPNNQIYVVRVGDKIVAMALCRLVAPEHVEHLANINSVFTDPEFRGQGIGLKLLEKVLKDLHNNSKTSRVTLSVGNENEPAKSMYQKLGFVQYGLGRKEMKVKGKYIDQAQMELIFEDKL